LGQIILVDYEFFVFSELDWFLPLEGYFHDSPSQFSNSPLAFHLVRIVPIDCAKHGERDKAAGEESSDPLFHGASASGTTNTSPIETRCLWAVNVHGVAMGRPEPLSPKGRINRIASH
jgi:hypothetical protein